MLPPLPAGRGRSSRSATRSRAPRTRRTASVAASAWSASAIAGHSAPSRSSHEARISSATHALRATADTGRGESSWNQSEGSPSRAPAPTVSTSKVSAPCVRKSSTSPETTTKHEAARAPWSKSAAPEVKRWAGARVGRAWSSASGTSEKRGTARELLQRDGDGRGAARGLSGALDAAELVGPEGVGARAREGEHGVAEREDGGVAVLGPEAHRAGDDGVEGGGDARPEGRGRGRAAARDLGHQLVDARAVAEGEVAGRALVDHHAERVLIAPGVEVLHPVDDLLGRHVRRRAQELARAGERHRGAALGDLRDAEVEQDGVLAVGPAPGEEDVVRLEVAVEDACLVRGGDGGEDREHQVGEPLHRQGAVLLQHAGERHPLEQVHRHERHALVRPDVGDAHHVRVLEARARARLQDEALHDIEAEREPGVQDLERHALVQVDVPRLVHARHPAGSDVAHHEVAPEGGAGLEQPLGPGRGSARGRRSGGAPVVVRAVHGNAPTRSSSRSTRSWNWRRCRITLTTAAAVRARAAAGALRRRISIASSPIS